MVYDEVKNRKKLFGNNAEQDKNKLWVLELSQGDLRLMPFLKNGKKAKETRS